MRIEIHPEENIAVLYVYTNTDAWTYTTSDEAVGHICGYLQAKGFDEQTAKDTASGLIQQALDTYGMSYKYGPHVLG